MDWHSRNLVLPRALAAFLEERLLALGHEQLSSERAPGDRNLRLRVWAASPAGLPGPETLAALLAEAEEAGLPASELRYEDETLPEQDWSRPFRQRFAAREILPGLRVAPPWDEQAGPHRPGDPLPGPEADLTLVIEPALAFGTGDHPTTRGMLDLLRRWRLARGPEPFEALDIGSGTGILSIAARLWGASRAEGFDIDSRSVLNACLNADLNGLAGQVRFRWGEPRELGEEAWDLILCNLFLTPILRYLPRMDRCLRPGGTVLLSGFLPHQAGRVAEAARARGWRPESEEDREGWILQQWRKPQ